MAPTPLGVGCSIDTRGASLVEYVIVLALVALVALGGYEVLGAAVSEQVDCAAAAIGSRGGPCGAGEAIASASSSSSPSSSSTLALAARGAHSDRHAGALSSAATASGREGGRAGADRIPRRAGGDDDRHGNGGHHGDHGGGGNGHGAWSFPDPTGPNLTRGERAREHARGAQRVDALLWIRAIRSGVVDLDDLHLRAGGGDRAVAQMVRYVMEPSPDEAYRDLRDGHGYSRYQSYIREASLETHVPENLLRAVIRAQSDFHPGMHHGGKLGLMQLDRETLRRFGAADAFAPRDNILAGARFLAELRQRRGDWMSALGRFRLPNWDGRHDKNGVPLADAAQNFVYKKVLPAYHSIVEGHGGAPFPGSASPEAILHNPNIVFINSVARHDLAAGIVDRRILAVLQVLSTRWEIGIWNFKTGHGKFTSFGTVSNHWFGRATDIGTVNGRPVSDQPKVAHDIIKFLWRMGKHDPLRPDEVGSPWDPGGGAGSDGFFTNAEHQNHIHLGFEHG